MIVHADATQALAFFGQVARRLSNTQALRRSLGELLVDSTRQRFVASRAPDGAAWKPLAPSTVAAWVEGFGKSYRTRSGGLNARGRQKLGARKPLVGATRRLATEIAYRLEGNDLLIGSTLEYAPHHQFGTRPRVIVPRHKKALAWPGARHPVTRVNHPGIPARPFIGLSDADARDLVATTADYLFASAGPNMLG